MPNQVIYHLHSDLSLLDSATKFQMYLDKAKEYGMKAIAFSEHGNVFNWIKKKEKIEECGLKYIHAMEAYVTESLDDKVRDNYHMIFIAKNWEGVKELNKMSSKAYYKNDGHFYYDARFTLDEVFNTSDNIMITTSCLGGLLWKGRNNEQLRSKFIDFATKNKHRVFLEIQYHDHPQQIEYNQYLYGLHKEHGLHLISGTDTHSLNEEYAMGRRILMQAKGMQFADEDKFDLTFKSYEQTIKMYEKQNALSKEVYISAVEFTNTMADMVEEFQLDKSHKYPKVEGDVKKIYKDKINEGVVKRGINTFEKNKRKLYFDRIKEEYDVYEKVGAIDYMLFQEDITSWANQNGIYHGYGRGSVNGSLIAYLLYITEMDSIKHKLNFFRFMNPERISLADIDIDWPPSRRQDVIDYVASKPNIHFCEIITFNTIADRGAIREVGRALNYDLDLVDEIAKNYETKEQHYRNKYPEMFKYVDLVKGVNVSVGSHPSGYVVSPIPLDENVGLFYTSGSKYPVSQVNMKELDGCNYVKLDMLGLDNIEITNDTCTLAGIERLVPDNMDVNDEKVWQSIRESNLGVFQWEGDNAHRYYKELFKPETIRKIEEQNPDFSFIELFSIGNGAIRPLGDSYREDLANGIFKDHGHKALNKSLRNTIGYLVYQEQIMNFLVEFCGFSMAQSDSVRRGLAKKEGTEQFLPSIRDGFVKTMIQNYGETKEHADQILEPFLQVISDASFYGFSDNHSNPYSHIGYGNAYLRYYYPLEFLTVMFNINENEIEKTAKIIDYAQSIGVKILPIKFRKSSAKYSFSKEENAIHKGLKSIKFLNDKIAEEMYELKDKKYETFIDLLVDITENTSVNTKQLNVLIWLNFFDEFGKNGKLNAIYEEFQNGENKYKKTYVEKTKIQRLEALKQIEKQTEEKELLVYEQLLFQKEYLGYIDLKFPDVEEGYIAVLSIDKKYSPKITAYDLKKGVEIQYKMSKDNFFRNGEDLINEGDIVKILKVDRKPRKRKDENGKWHDMPEKEDWISACKVVRRSQ